MDNKRCIITDEISTMDGSNSHSGVQRCRDTVVTNSGSGKRRKVDFRDQKNIHCRSGVDVNSPEDGVSSAESGSCDHVLSSPCFQNCLRLDLKAELRFEIETSTSVNGGFSEVTITSSEICLDSDKMESFSIVKRKPAPPTAVISRRTPPATAAKTPTTAEIEEFFSVAEKKEQKRFSEKYNFDIVNDVPMDGRYQWVRLKP